MSGRQQSTGNTADGAGHPVGQEIIATGEHGRKSRDADASQVPAWQALHQREQKGREHALKTMHSLEYSRSVIVSAAGMECSSDGVASTAATPAVQMECMQRYNPGAFPALQVG